MYSGGYWENLPLLNRVSGPMRYQQFVDTPIPDHIYSVRGGYKGFPTGWIETGFRYHGDFAKPQLGNWNSVPINPKLYERDRGVQIIDTWGHLVDVKLQNATQVKLYEKFETGDKQACCFIIINEAKKIGALIVPRSCEGIDAC